MDILGYVFLAVGAVISAFNVYTLNLRYLINKIIFKGKKEQKWVSGIPLIGTIFLIVSIMMLRHIPWVLFTAVGFIAVDAGGPLWYLIKIIKKESSEDI